MSHPKTPTVVLTALLLAGALLAPGSAASAASDTPSGYAFERDWTIGGSSEFDVASTVGPDGLVYVVTAFHVGDEHSMHVYTPAGVQVAQWSVEPGGVLGGMQADAAGNLHVAQFLPEEGLVGGVLVYSPSGQLVRRYHVPAGDTTPSDVAVAADGGAYVVDYNDDLVSRFSADGTFLGSWGTTGSAPSEFLKPTSIAVAGGNVYVADEDANQVKVFTADGTFVRAWGQAGGQPGQFTEPDDIEIGPEGHVLVRDDYGDGRIQEFSADGAFIAQTVMSEVGRGGFAVGGDAVYATGQLKSTTFSLHGVARYVRATTPPTATATPVIRSKRLDVKKRKVTVKVHCRGEARCSGRVVVQRKGSTLAKGRYRVPAGKTSRVRVKLTKKGRTMVARHRRTKAVVKLTYQGGRVRRAVVIRRR